MKKLLFLVLIIGLAFSFEMSAQKSNLGYEQNLNEHCGPIYGGPNEDECTSEYELYVYYPLNVDCTCPAQVCIGWFTPGATYTLSQDEADIIQRSFSWEVYGELDYWVAVHGQITETDGDVTLSDFVWQTKPPPFVWTAVASANPVTGDFMEDFQLNGLGMLSGIGDWGYRYFRAYANTVTIGPGAHGWYHFTGTLEAHYNF